MTYPYGNSQFNIYGSRSDKGAASTFPYEEKMRRKFDSRGLNLEQTRVIHNTSSNARRVSDPAVSKPAMTKPAVNAVVRPAANPAAKAAVNPAAGGRSASNMGSSYAGTRDLVASGGGGNVTPRSFREKYWMNRGGMLPVAASIAKGEYKRAVIIGAERNKSVQAAGQAGNIIELTKTGIIKKADRAMAKISRRKEKIKMPEIIIRRSRVNFPAAAVLMLTVCLVAVMLLVYGTSLISNITNDISRAQKENTALAQREQELILELEIKNDLRVIEDIAINEYGMIRKDLAEKKYLNLSGGDSVVMYDTAAEKSPGAIMSLLSAFRFTTD